MRVDALSSHIEQELSYPVDRQTVIEQIGSLEIPAPDHEDSESIAVILDSLGPETYDSADELYRTIVGNVGSEYVGRQYYDDRGQHSPVTSDRQREDRDVSF